jgi:hypothetical protein
MPWKAPPASGRAPTTNDRSYLLRKGSNDSSLWNAFAGGTKETAINVAGFDEFPQQCQKALICNALANSSHQEPMMNRVKIAGQIAFYYPATDHPILTVTILQLELHRSDRMVNAAFGSEAVGKPMKIAFPNRLHRHQHRPLHDSITQTRDT